MKPSKEYRIARLIILNDLIKDLTEKEPDLFDLTDFHSNQEAINQMITLIDEEKA